MLKMRLQRIGRKNDPSFRVVVTESTRGPKSGKHIALLGSYNPKLNQFQVNSEEAKSWIAKGVQVSDTVHNLLVSKKVIEGKKVNVLPRKAPIAKEGAEEAATAETAAAPATDAPAEPTSEEAAAGESVQEAEAEAEKSEEASAPAAEDK